MGCLKLTYGVENPRLRVVSRNFSMKEKSSAGVYRYGFNGKEKDDEVAGSGNQYDYGFRIYNPRLGKFLSVDPLTKDYPWYTPYQFAGNKPIGAVDLDGLEELWYTHYFIASTGETYIQKERWSDIEGNSGSQGPLGSGTYHVYKELSKGGVLNEYGNQYNPSFGDTFKDAGERADNWLKSIEGNTEYDGSNPNGSKPYQLSEFELKILKNFPQSEVNDALKAFNVSGTDGGGTEFDRRGFEQRQDGAIDGGGDQEIYMNNRAAGASRLAKDTADHMQRRGFSGNDLKGTQWHPSKLNEEKGFREFKDSTIHMDFE